MLYVDDKTDKYLDKLDNKFDGCENYNRELMEFVFWSAKQKGLSTEEAISILVALTMQFVNVRLDCMSHQMDNVSYQAAGLCSDVSECEDDGANKKEQNDNDFDDHFGNEWSDENLIDYIIKFSKSTGMSIAEVSALTTAASLVNIENHLCFCIHALEDMESVLREANERKRKKCERLKRERLMKHPAPFACVEDEHRDTGGRKSIFRYDLPMDPKPNEPED